MVIYRILADLTVTLHAAFVGFALFGQAAVLYGVARRRDWARNPWFRWSHLGAILFIVVLTWSGSMCPLTVWENNLRERAGEAAYPGDFIAYWVRELLFYDLPTRVFFWAYSLFGAIVLLTFVLAPPRWPSLNKGRAPR